MNYRWKAFLTIPVLLIAVEAQAGVKQWGGWEDSSFSNPENWTLPGLEPVGSNN